MVSGPHELLIRAISKFTVQSRENDLWCRSCTLAMSSNLEKYQPCKFVSTGHLADSAHSRRNDEIIIRAWKYRNLFAQEEEESGPSRAPREPLPHCRAISRKQFHDHEGTLMSASIRRYNIYQIRKLATWVYSNGSRRRVRALWWGTEIAANFFRVPLKRRIERRKNQICWTIWLYSKQIWNPVSGRCQHYMSMRPQMRNILLRIIG